MHKFPSSLYNIMLLKALTCDVNLRTRTRKRDVLRHDYLVYTIVDNP
jgi:hypothetical protein